MPSYLVTLTANLPHLQGRTLRFSVGDPAQARRVALRLGELPFTRSRVDISTTSAALGAVVAQRDTWALERWLEGVLTERTEWGGSDVGLPLEDTLLRQRATWELLALAQRRLGHLAEGAPFLDDRELLQMSATELGELLVKDAEAGGFSQVHADAILALAIPENFVRLLELYTQAVGEHPGQSLLGQDDPVVATLGTAMVLALDRDEGRTIESTFFAHDVSAAQSAALAEFRERFSEELAALGLEPPIDWGSAGRA